MLAARTGPAHAAAPPVPRKSAVRRNAPVVYMCVGESGRKDVREGERERGNDREKWWVCRQRHEQARRVVMHLLCVCVWVRVDESERK